MRSNGSADHNEVGSDLPHEQSWGREVAWANRVEWEGRGGWARTNEVGGTSGGEVAVWSSQLIRHDCGVQQSAAAAGSDNDQNKGTGWGGRRGRTSETASGSDTDPTNTGCNALHELRYIVSYPAEWWESRTRSRDARKRGLHRLSSCDL